MVVHICGPKERRGYAKQIIAHCVRGVAATIRKRNIFEIIFTLHKWFRVWITFFLNQCDKYGTKLTQDNMEDIV